MTAFGRKKPRIGDPIATATPPNPFAFFGSAAPGAGLRGMPSLDELADRLVPASMRAEMPPPPAPEYPSIRGTGYRIPIISRREPLHPRFADASGGLDGTAAQRQALIHRMRRDALADHAKSAEGRRVNTELSERPVIADEMAGPFGLESEGQKRDGSEDKPTGKDRAASRILRDTTPEGIHESDPAVLDAGPPTRNAVDAKSMIDALGFDVEGPTQLYVALQHPREAYWAQEARKRAAEIAHEEFPKVRRLHNNAGDAFRHALWSYRVAREFSPQLAKEFGDAHEIAVVNSTSERLMDLYNNNVGRRLALDPRNHGIDDVALIKDALRRGELQTQPFNITSGTEPPVRSKGIYVP